MECVWVLDHLEDLDADFIRFYRIYDFYELSFIRFFNLAVRTPAYGGVMAVRVEQAQEEAKKHNPSKGLRDGTAKEVPLSEIMSMDFTEPT
jgi:hypothetical protein